MKDIAAEEKVIHKSGYHTFTRKIPENLKNIIDVQKSLLYGKMILLEGTWERKMGSGNIYE